MTLHTSDVPHASDAPAAATPALRAIPRVVNISFGEFRRDFLATSTPVIVSGSLDGWPRRGRLSLDRIVEVCGGRSIYPPCAREKVVVHAPKIASKRWGGLWSIPPNERLQNFSDLIAAQQDDGWAGELLEEGAGADRRVDVRGAELYLFDAPYAPAKEFILSGLQWLARCAFAMLNRIERQKGATLTEDQKLRILKLMHTKVHQSRCDVLAPAFPEGDDTKKPLIFVVECAAMPAPANHPLAGRAMLPLLIGFCEPTNRKELTSTDFARFYRVPILQGWLTALWLHVGAAPPDNQDDLDVVRATLGGKGGPTGSWVTYWGFDNDDRGAYAVLYGMSHGNVLPPKDIADELMSPAHTKGLLKLLALNSYATRKLILEAAKRGRVCGDVQIIKLLRKRADFHTVDPLSVK